MDFNLSLFLDLNLTSYEHGVPQDSVLCPLPFLIYINDLHNVIKHSSVYLFADYTNLLKVSNSYKSIQKQMNFDLKGLRLWLLANKITLNETKIEMVIFRRPGQSISLNLRISNNGQRLYPTICIKYIGIDLDEYLRGTSHIEIVQTKLRIECYQRLDTILH